MIDGDGFAKVLVNDRWRWFCKSKSKCVIEKVNVNGDVFEKAKVNVNVMRVASSKVNVCISNTNAAEGCMGPV